MPMNVELIKEIIKYGGTAATMLVMALILGVFVIRDNSDRYTGTEARSDKAATVQRMEASEDAARTQRESNAREIAALKTLVRDERDARARTMLLLTQMQGTMSQVAADLRRTSEDVKGIKGGMQAMSERLVKVETWQDGPGKDDK